MDVYTVTGKRVPLREPALSSGGEGAVYEIIGHSNKVAKIYHDIRDAKLRESKITEMGKYSETYTFKLAQITNDVAWPLAPLYDKSHNFIGFGMNRISAATELDDLYLYPAKRNSNVTIENKIDCLISLCGVIDKLHRAGQVFGDFNPNNIKIKRDWTVSFVDADSYHVKSNGRTYPCIVCAPGYVAPEVIKACKGTTYEACNKTTFTKESDYFALAIHCFRMLMNGCHPYNCERHMKKAGSAPAPKPTDKRVESGETPFFKSISNYTVPHYAPDITSLPPYIISLFKRAFVEGHSNPKARPDAMEWRSALYRYKNELNTCDKNRTHYYWNGNCTCPYCEADERHSKKILSKKMSGGNGVQKPRSQTVNAVSTLTSSGNRNSSYTTQNVAGTTNAQTKSFNTSSMWFWIISLVVSVALVAWAGMEILPQCYWSFFEDTVLVEIGVWGSIISGMVGCIIYNHYWSFGRKNGKYQWYDYILSPLTTIGFMIGFGLAMVLVLLVLYILMYVFVFALIIGFIIALLSGG